MKWITNIIFDSEEGDYYIMCNKFQEKLGFFVLKINQMDPNTAVFLLRWKNKLEIDDTSMYVLRDNNTGFKELIIGFKTIYINLYNLWVMDITLEN